MSGSLGRHGSTKFHCTWFGPPVGGLSGRSRVGRVFILVSVEIKLCLPSYNIYEETSNKENVTRYIGPLARYKRVFVVIGKLSTYNEVGHLYGIN